MDPLPFLILAVIIFWLIQLGAWTIDYYKKGQSFTGGNRVANKQWIIKKIQKAKKAKK